MFDVRIYWFRLWVTCRKQSRGGELIEWLTDLFIQCEFIHLTEQQVDGILVCKLIADSAYSFQVQYLEGKLSWRNYNTMVLKCFNVSKKCKLFIAHCASICCCVYCVFTENGNWYSASQVIKHWWKCVHMHPCIKWQQNTLNPNHINSWEMASLTSASPLDVTPKHEQESDLTRWSNKKHFV